jgi:hypothetical protein
MADGVRQTEICAPAIAAAIPISYPNENPAGGTAGFGVTGEQAGNLEVAVDRLLIGRSKLRKGSKIFLK